MTKKHTWYERLVACKEALKQRVKYNENIELNRTQRWFYTTKAIICLMIGRQKNLYTTDDKIDSVANWGYWTSLDGGGNWTELAVGRGVLRNWYYDIYKNGW